MKYFGGMLWACFCGLAISVGSIFLLGGDPFFGYFTERETRTFPVCKRDLFSDLGDDLEEKYFSYPVATYEVICGYTAAVGSSDYGEISDELVVTEGGKLIAKDTPLGATYTVECARYQNPPQRHHSRGWIVLDMNLYCEMPIQGYSPPRD